MALGVTAATESIFEAFLSDDRRKTLFHGHSFTANPLACTAALASLDLLLEADCMTEIHRISERHSTFLDTLRSFPSSKTPVRWVPSLPSSSIPAGTNTSTPSARPSPAKPSHAGIYLRPLGNTVYLMPPYCITEKEMDQVYDFLVHCIRKYSDQPVTS